MKKSILLFSTIFCLNVGADGPADNLADKVRSVPPEGAKIEDPVRRDLEEGVAKLGQEIQSLRESLKSKPGLSSLLPDVQIHHNAVRYALTYNEIFNPATEIPAARNLLSEGMKRAQALAGGQAPWNSSTGLVVRGYLSKIDGSVQPYGLVIPPSYSPGNGHAYRLDAWFHGRDEKLSELNFLAGRLRSPGEFVPPNTFVLHLYGRYCNANKLAGEMDLLEALADVRKRYSIDENRIVVRGFSMGGAACWQFAVHYAGLWAAAAPGAGFSETADFLKVFQNEAVNPPPYEQKLWHLYDCTDYAINLFNCPTVAYSGEIDRQKQAADMMAKAMEAEGMTLTHIIGPQTPHRYHPDSKVQINERIDAIAAIGRNPVPKKVKFTTWTLRYNQMLWVTLDAMEKHWERARVDAELVNDHRVSLSTSNADALTLSMPSGQCPLDSRQTPKITIDRQELNGAPVLSDRSWVTHLRKVNGKWETVASADDGTLRKRHGLQGPIDDAFMDSFLMVSGTGPALNEKVSNWVKTEEAHAIDHWRSQFRGEARVTTDDAVTDADIAAHNLVLWGDPQSNKLLARIADKLPIMWNRNEIKTGGKTYAADQHVPVLVFPNPLNPKRYVVLNSGFTFREYDYLNNARQVPKLPDFAIIDISSPRTSRGPGKVAEAGFFGEHWELVR